MLQKFTFILLVTMLSVSIGLAQKQNVYFLKNNGQEVKIRDSADYVRIIREPDSGSVAFNFVEYYLNGKTKRIGKTSFSNSIKQVGQSVSYYKTGQRQKVNNYKDGELDGEQYTYYPNGILYAVVDYYKTRFQ